MVFRLSSRMGEGELSVTVCFPWCAGQSLGVVDGVVSDLHWGNWPSSALRRLFMLGYVGATL